MTRQFRSQLVSCFGSITHCSGHGAQIHLGSYCSIIGWNHKLYHILFPIISMNPLMRSQNFTLATFKQDKTRANYRRKSFNEEEEKQRKPSLTFKTTSFTFQLALLFSYHLSPLKTMRDLEDIKQASTFSVIWPALYS